MWYEVPLSGSDEQFLVSVLGIQYTFIVFYREAPYNSWTLSIKDVDGNGLVGNIPLVTGCDLLEPFRVSLGLQFSLFVSTDGDPLSPPTETNLGVNSHLYVRT